MKVKKLTVLAFVTLANIKLFKTILQCLLNSREREGEKMSEFQVQVSSC